jgi:mRNA interferase MazF
LIISSAGSKRGDIWLANFDPTVGAEIKYDEAKLYLLEDEFESVQGRLLAVELV